MSENIKKVCQFCKESIPNDSEFCQVCGSKLIDCFEDNKERNEEKVEKNLANFDIMEIKGFDPVLVLSAHLFASDVGEQLYLRCKFKSISDKIISALMFDVFCFDVWGNELQPIKSAQILDLCSIRDEVFGFSQKIPILDTNTRVVQIELKKIRFSDGTIEECFGEKRKLPQLKPLNLHFDSGDLFQQYIFYTSEQASYYPLEFDEFWVCTCGEINSSKENLCAQCAANKQFVFDALDESFLSNNYDKYVTHLKEQENAERRKQDEIRENHIRGLTNDSFEKRLELANESQKRRKVIQRIVISVVAIILFIFIICLVNTAIRNNQLRNFDTEEMHEDFTNVYADIVSMRPKYFLSTSYNYSQYLLNDIVCECVTVEGNTVWIVVDVLDYPDGSYTEENNEPQYYSISNPKRIFGSVTTASEVADELEERIGNVFVLEVSKSID